MFAVTARLRWPTCSPILAHGTPPKCSSEILWSPRTSAATGGTLAFAGDFSNHVIADRLGLAATPVLANSEA